jgi:phenylacetate-CoA ligase
MGAYGGLLHNVIFPLWEGTVRGRPTMRHLDALERSQWCSLDELHWIQGSALRGLIAHAYANVPYYRTLMERRGLEPRDLGSVEDLARLPLLTREAAMNAGDRRKSTAAPFCDLKKMTGGSTGEPLRFGYDLGSEYWRQAVKLRGWGWSGYRVGDRTLYYWGPATTVTPPLRVRAKVAADRLLKRENYVDCTNRGPSQLAAVARMLVTQRPERLICYTQAGVDLARYIIEQDLRVPQIPVMCCAERLDVHGRNLLEAAFGPQVYETYGCREVMLIGSECEAHDGLHLSMENLIVEVLVRDGDRVRPAAYGELGEVALTDLHNYGMPFIRYLNGDLAIAGKTGRCSCGRGLARISSVEGRVADTLLDARGEPVCGILFSRIFSWSEALAGAVSHWQAVQHRDGSVTLKLEIHGNIGEAALADLRRSFGKYMKGVPVRTEVVEHIAPGSNGKRQTVVVERN